MPDYTTPMRGAFQMQRQTIEAGQRALEQSVEFQGRLARAMLSGVESQQRSQQRTVELTQSVLHNTLDAVDQNVPGVSAQVEELRQAVDDQYELLLDAHAELFEDWEADLDEMVDAYEDAGTDGLAALDDQLDFLLEAHEDLETRSADAVDQMVEMWADLQAEIEEQTSDVQAQVREVQQQTVEAVET